MIQEACLFAATLSAQRAACMLHRCQHHTCISVTWCQNIMAHTRCFLTTLPNPNLRVCPVLQNAFKSYVRTRDYCTTSKHIVSMCLNVIRISIELANYVHVTNYVSKAEQAPDTQGTVVASKLRAASGLAHLFNKKYKQAAKRFCEVRLPCA